MNRRLLEDGSIRLLEDGFARLLEGEDEEPEPVPEVGHTDPFGATSASIAGLDPFQADSEPKAAPP